MASEIYKITISEFEKFFKALNNSNYDIIGPTIEQDAIVYEKIMSITDLPVGWTEVQDKGHYSLKKREDNVLFGYNVGPNSWKKYLFPAEQKLSTIRLVNGKFVTEQTEVPVPSYAFLGVRACDLNAVMKQDRIFLNSNALDSYYQKVRENSLIIGVNCTLFSENCFCTSMNTGPDINNKADIELTEVCGEQHYLLVKSTTIKGDKITNALTMPVATQKEIEAGNKLVNSTANNIKKRFNNTGVKELLARNHNNPAWDDIVDKCLHCGNCTLVCPTCFCSRVDDKISIDGAAAERWQSWDSCFNVDHSYIHGGSIRKNPNSRYRQWLTHKFSSWYDQFGESGCVGCGRCITWCPVGIDVTTEIEKIRHSESENEID